MLGAPGAGKGTQAKQIAAKYEIPHISTGDIFRANIKNGTELGKKAKEYMDQGMLVPDELTCDLVMDRIAQDDCERGFVLDGFPRTIPQAEALTNALTKIGQSMDYAIDVDVPDENIVNRMSGRRACLNCGATYHIVFNPTKADGVCDACGKLFLDEEATQPTTLADVTLDKLPVEEPDDPVTPPVEPEDPVVPPVEPEDPVVPPVEPEDPVVPPVEKEDVVYVPEEEIHEQVKDEAGKLTDMIVNDELEEGVVSEETLEKVQQAIENDEEIITELVIENMKDVEVDESAKELVEEAVKDIIENAASTIAQYLDIKVVLKTEESGEELGTLNKLSEEITLTFEIPDEWKKEGRTFHVIRVHEGKTDVLDVWENEDGTVSFKTDRFSTYALVYTDAEVEEDITPTPPVTPEVTPPSTGDNSMPGVYFLVLLAGFAMAIAGMTVSRRKM